VTPVKRLIVNADDLGRTPGVNRGIVEAHRDGIVTSATLMVSGEAAGEVPRLAAENPGLGIGLHVVMSGGRAISPPGEIPSLADAEGRLPRHIEGAVNARSKDVLLEARAQLRRFRELMNRDPTHLDGHHHCHRLEAVFEALVTLAWETGLPVRSVSPEMRQRLRRERIATPDHFVDSFYGPEASLESLVRLIGSLPLSTTELMCHPGYVDEALKQGSSYAAERDRERQALVHRETRQAIQAAGAKLVGYNALVGA